MVVSFDIKGHTVLVDEQDAHLLERFRWHVLQPPKSLTPYVHGRYSESGPLKSVSLQRVVMGQPIGKQIDHINRNGLDNRRENLRLCTRSQNVAYAQRRTGKSNFRGVYLIEGAAPRHRWKAKITVQGRGINLGLYATVEDGARAYDTAAIKYFGEFACLNFPNEYVDLRKADRTESSHYDMTADLFSQSSTR